MNSAIKLCEKANDAALKLDKISDRLEGSLAQLADTQEKAEDIKAVAYFGIKFKKEKAPRCQLTVDGIHTIINDITEVTANLSADCRVCKAHAVAQLKSES